MVESPHKSRKLMLFNYKFRWKDATLNEIIITGYLNTTEPNIILFVLIECIFSWSFQILIWNHINSYDIFLKFYAKLKLSRQLISAVKELNITSSKFFSIYHRCKYLPFTPLVDALNLSSFNTHSGPTLTTSPEYSTKFGHLMVPDYQILGEPHSIM